MAELLNTTDLQAFNGDIDAMKAAKIVEFVNAEAVRIAPCLKTTTDADLVTAAKGTLVRAALRWADQGSGAFQQWSNTDGPFSRMASMDTRTGTSHNIFYPSEEAKLRQLCPASSARAKSGWLL